MQYTSLVLAFVAFTSSVVSVPAPASAPDTVNVQDVFDRLPGSEAKFNEFNVAAGCIYTGTPDEQCETCYGVCAFQSPWENAGCILYCATNCC